MSERTGHSWTGEDQDRPEREHVPLVELQERTIERIVAQRDFLRRENARLNLELVARDATIADLRAQLSGEFIGTENE